MSGLPQAGDHFGRYEILRVIGRGGMGTVFAARQVDLDRLVALKVLSSDLAADEGYRRRFAQEASVLGQIDSPEVIHVYEAGEHEGWLFIATQYVEGGDLQARLKASGPLDPALALDVVAQAAAGLNDAHERGILHRDIKPSNILVRDRADGLRAYLCDLGISQLLDSEHTRTTGVIGTLGYMAPERHEGADASIASDVYGLGCVLWAALSGSPPYRGTDLSVALAHINDPLPQVDATTPGADAINAILTKSMAKAPGDRYPDAAAMLVELRAAVASIGRPARVSPVVAPPPPLDPPVHTSVVTPRVVAPPPEASAVGSPREEPPGFPSSLSDAEAALTRVRERKPTAGPADPAQSSREPTASAIEAEPPHANDAAEPEGNPRRPVRKVPVLVGILVMLLALSGTAFALSGSDPGGQATPTTATSTPSPRPTPTPLTAGQQRALLRQSANLAVFGAGGLAGAARAAKKAAALGWDPNPPQGWADRTAGSRIYYGKGLKAAALLLGRDLRIKTIRPHITGTSGSALTLVVAQGYGAPAPKPTPPTGDPTPNPGIDLSNDMVTPIVPEPPPPTEYSYRIEVRHTGPRPCELTDCQYVQIRLVGWPPDGTGECSVKGTAGNSTWTKTVSTNSNGGTIWFGGQDLYDSEGDRFVDSTDSSQFTCQLNWLGPPPTG